MMAVQFFVVLMVYPETKQLSLEQLQEQMQAIRPTTAIFMSNIEVEQSQ
jgi:translation elongation factor EF-1beta